MEEAKEIVARYDSPGHFFTEASEEELRKVTHEIAKEANEEQRRVFEKYNQ